MTCNSFPSFAGKTIPLGYQDISTQLKWESTVSLFHICTNISYHKKVNSYPCSVEENQGMFKLAHVE